ncbi:Oidioi.mRNA.OKI2018_I69.chr2.g6837.t1.cds [Oikopleura dioica]|uniref:Oidioi.mRNA.OKI2018_I69.chr2.g6837.t1.cds n=1 Tax=Oikopleura dioica TaxID=34765 RepID=A0ABN7TAU8_OIKDI|nr:Oidioi.mRNA.OKI2018_I69.chr2.g6837.t1.cds [Oikopleura dioica]
MGNYQNYENPKAPGTPGTPGARNVHILNMTGSRPQSPIHAKKMQTINRPSSAQITQPSKPPPLKPSITPSVRPASAHIPKPTAPSSPVTKTVSRPVPKTVTSPLVKEVSMAPKWPQQTPERQFSFSVSTRSPSESSFGNQPLSPPVNSPPSQKADNLSTWLGRGKQQGASNGNSSPSQMAGMSQVYHNPTPEPSDSKVVICFQCKQIIDGKFFTAMGQHWHPECFKCSIQGCSMRLDLHGYIEENGSPYCRKCYEDEMAYSCSKCGLKIIGDIMHALNQTWHLKCFCCCVCGVPFNDGVFHFVGERPYCQNDAPGGPFVKDGANDSDSFDDSCSLLTSDSYNLDGIQSVAGDRPVSMMSYQSSIMPRYQMDPAQLGSLNRLYADRRKPTKDEDLRMQTIKNRWAKINAISRDYEKTPSLSKRYMNTK